MKNSIKYSQNFLTNPSLVETLINRSSIGLEDIVYEIGAGTGVITDQLAKHSKEVVAIEADNRLYENLKEKFQNNPKIKIILGDFLNQPLPESEYKVFSNIPFNITANIVRKLVEAQNPPLDTYLFVQKEAAQKLAGMPYANQETQFAVITKPWFEFRVVHKFNKTDFRPVPAIDIVLLQIEKRDKPLIEISDRNLYRDFVVYAFNSTKPTLEKGLKDLLTHSQFVKLSNNLRFSLKATPSQLNFEQWVGLFKYFIVGVPEDKKQLVGGSYEKLRQQQGKIQKIHRTRTAKDWKRN